jgi:hypothetical protein
MRILLLSNYLVNLLVLLFFRVAFKIEYNGYKEILSQYGGFYVEFL